MLTIFMQSAEFLHIHVYISFIVPKSTYYIQGFISLKARGHKLDQNSIKHYKTSDINNASILAIIKQPKLKTLSRVCH